jgi:hypothetical protein
MNNLPKRFAKNVDFSGECWMWNGYRIKGRYGHFNAGNKKMLLAHRFSWVHFNGDIPEGLYVLHKCDVPYCVNPNHLFLGTQQDNMDDMVRKGRQGRTGGAKGDKNGSRTCPDSFPKGEDHWMNKHPEKVQRGENHWSVYKPESIPRGEKHHSTKLTDVDIEKIRSLYIPRSREFSQCALAKKFGVCQTHISDIINNKKRTVRT